MADGDDVDMTTSLTLTPHGQNHDREPVDMDIDNAVVGARGNENNARDEAEREASGARGDVMDTSPDVVQEPTSNVAPSVPEPSQQTVLPSNGSGQTEPQVPPQNPTSETPQPGPNATITEVNRQEPTPASYSNLVAALATPTSPRPEEPQANPENDDEDSSSDDESMSHSWHEIKEDISAPDEKELKDIEAAGEVSALDHKHWEEKTYVEIRDPEHKPADSGHLEWTVENFNGTKEEPNKDMVMRSPIASIGGHDWQIKFYPRGNDSDYLSVYIENLSVASTEESDPNTLPSVPIQPPSKRSSGKGTKKSKGKQKPTPKTTLVEQYLNTAIPLLDNTPIPKRRSVAAQISVLMYNPSEPRVHAFHTAQHRFCPLSADWGWTRFYGPHYEIQFRQRGQRQAMLRNDKLAFTAYIRVIDDATDCLWEHNTTVNPWDSFAMTGIRGLKTPGAWSPGGNLISALSSWLLLKPVRQLLYDARAPNSFADGYVRPKPFILTLQRILYDLRHRSSEPVCLDPLFEAFRWYGISTDIRELDSVQIMEILRLKLQEELNGTPLEGRLTEIFGSPKNKSTGTPTYRIPNKQNRTMRCALENNPTDLVDPIEAPCVLQLEIQRQDFDSEQKMWKKVVDKVKLEDYINHPQGTYVLYGFIVHKDHLQSGQYYSVLRPGGPGSKWYQFMDAKDSYMVHCLTKKQAIDSHEGRSPQNNEKQHSPVAYVVFYVREDIAQSVFNSASEEPWDVPLNVKSGIEVPRVNDASKLSPEPPKPAADGPGSLQPQVLRVFDAQTTFRKHQGPGIVDVFESNTDSEGVYSIEIQPNWERNHIQTALAEIIPGVQDPDQCEYYLMYASGPFQLSQLPSSVVDDDEYGPATGESICTAVQKKDAIPVLWVYILPIDQIRKSSSVSNGTTPTPIPSGANEAIPSVPNTRSQLSNADTGGDTPMSDPDDVIAVDPPSSTGGTAANDQNTTPLVPPLADSEMSGTQDHPTEMNGGNNQPTSSSPEASAGPDAEIEILHEGEQHILLKEFHTSTQQLLPVGAFWIQTEKLMYGVLREIMGWTEDMSFNVYEEVDGITNYAHEISNITASSTKTFEQCNLPEIGILIVQLVVPDDDKDRLLTEGKFADPATYLQHFYATANFPWLASGTVVHDYFGSEFYAGHVQGGQPHGEGRKTYHNNTSYEGSFALGMRHGAGKMTYATGDTYTGAWRRDERAGHGEFVEAATGNRYVGHWACDKKSGEGVTYWVKHAADERVCRVCWEQEADTAFYDCGHVVSCGECAGQLEQCPVCRKRVMARLKLYFVA